MQTKQTFFNIDMTTTQIIEALETYNRTILDRIYNNEDYQDLLADFRQSRVADNPKYRKAYDIYNLTQPEFYLSDTGVNITPEAYRFIDTFEITRENMGFASNVLDVIDTIQRNVYATLLDYETQEAQFLSLSSYDLEGTAFEAIRPKDHELPKQKRELEKRLRQFRDLCKKWNIPQHMDKKGNSKTSFREAYRDKDIKLIQDDLYANIRELIDLRAKFVPRYIVDYDGNSLSTSIYELVEKLELKKTFTERYDFVFGKNAPHFKKGYDETRYMIRPVAVTGGSIPQFIKKTLKTKYGELHTKYKSSAEEFMLRNSSRNFIIALFFYLCLPFEQFKEFLEYHGYSVTEYLPLILGADSVDGNNDSYTEKANIFYKDIEALYDLGLSYNTIMVVCFGESPIPMELKSEV